MKRVANFQGKQKFFFHLKAISSTQPLQLLKAHLRSRQDHANEFTISRLAAASNPKTRKVWWTCSFSFSPLVPSLKPKSYTHTHTHTYASESIRFSCKYRARCALAPEQSKAGRLFGIATYNAVLFRGVWLRCQLLTLTARARYLDEMLVRVATLFKWSFFRQIMGQLPKWGFQNEATDSETYCGGKAVHASSTADEKKNQKT